MSDEESPRLEIYKMAYQVAASRYENIYRSIWTIFSYMTAVSAGILSFAGSKFYGEPLTVLTCVPLVFWFWTTYRPLDRYGNDALSDLKRLEEIFQRDFSVAINHFGSFDKQRAKWKGLNRARPAILFFMTLVHIALLWGLFVSVQKRSAGHSLVRPPSRSVTVHLPE